MHSGKATWGRKVCKVNLGVREVNLGVVLSQDNARTVVRKCFKLRDELGARQGKKDELLIKISRLIKHMLS